MSQNERHKCGLSTDEYHKLTGFDGDWRDSWWDDAYLQLMANTWGFEQIESVLDVGSGVGHWGQRLLQFLPASATLQGIDAEEAWAQKAQDRAEKKGVSNQTRYELGPAEKLPYADDSYDLVTCQTLLMHVSDPAAVVREMVRVLKPGGLFLAAEPNNFASASSQMMQEPEVNWAQAQEILEFEFRLTRGKQALGEGQSSIGQRLPEYLHECGLHQIQVKMNNNSALKLPPYERAFDEVETSMLREAQASNNVLCHGSSYDNALRYFLAGGGSSERFAELWKAVFEYQRRKLELLESGQFFSAGGFIHYLQWARKPL